MLLQRTCPWLGLLLIFDYFEQGLCQLFDDHVRSVPPYMVIRSHIEQVRFQCYVDGLPARKGETKWSRENHTVECDHDNRMFACDNIIIITQIRPEDAGEYTCTLTGNDSTSNSFTAKIFVPASFASPGVEAISVKLGASVELHSPVSGFSYPQPTYVMWRKGMHYLAEGQTLHLNNFNENMTGLYESVIFNGYGEPAVKAYQIKVQEIYDVRNDFSVFVERPGIDGTNFQLDSVNFESVSHSGSKHFISTIQYLSLTAVVIFLSCM